MAIGRAQSVRELAEMRAQLGDWDLQPSEDPVPKGRLLGGATLLTFSPRELQLVMGWHPRPEVRGHGVAGHIAQDLPHQAVLPNDVNDLVFTTPAQIPVGHAVAKRLGMTVVNVLDWRHHGVRFKVLRMRRIDLHAVRYG
jgi:hypothetical protein